MISHKNTVTAAALLFYAVFTACGDDGTERLSSCPDLRIETDKMGIIRCAGPKPSEDEGAAKPTKSAGASGRQGVASNANRASSGDSPASGSAGKPAAADGAAAGKPAAESGEDAPAASGGGGTPAPSNPPAPGNSGNSAASGGGGWYCVQVMNACSCVKNASLTTDTCDKPRPTCCVSVKNDASVETCVCYPEGSTECMGVKQAPSVYPPVSSCPP